MSYTIKEIADLAGVTPRTLRHYDQIGLFCPSGTSDNGYRYYDQESLLRLQQILFFRELGMPLKEIHLILNHPGFDLLDALEAHRRSLQERSRRLEQLLHTVDRTIATLQGKGKMTAKDYFEGFDERQYEAEARERWGHTPQWAESRRKWASYSQDQKEAIQQEGSRITQAMVGTDPNLRPDDPAVQASVGEYYTYLNRYFYACPLGFLRNLADMWVEDPRFAINYERIREGGAAFVREAVHIYCDKHE